MNYLKVMTLIRTGNGTSALECSPKIRGFLCETPQPIARCPEFLHRLNGAVAPGTDCIRARPKRSGPTGERCDSSLNSDLSSRTTERATAALRVENVTPEASH